MDTVNHFPAGCHVKKKVKGRSPRIILLKAIAGLFNAIDTPKSTKSNVSNMLMSLN